MNIALSLPRGLRHPSWYAPLLLPIFPMIGVYEANDTSQFDYALCAGSMLVLGLLYTLGLSAFLSRTTRLVRKEVEQLKPAWLLGLFAAQSGLLFSGGPDITPFLVIVPPFLYALLAALSLGIEFQQRTMPALLCAPIDRLRVWRIKMCVLGAALASIVLVLALCMATNNVAGQPHYWVYLGLSAGLAFAAWATVPLWTLLTRNLLAGLVFAFAVPPLTLSILFAVLDWVTPSQGLLGELSDWTVGSLGLVYVLGSPFLCLRRWLTLEAPDQPEKELSVFINRGRSATRALTQRSWLRSLIGKELRLQSITILSLAIAFILVFLKPLAPQAVVSQELIGLLTGLFSVVAILLAGSTAIAEERRLGTLDSHVLLPVSRTMQWWVKLLLGLFVTIAATGLIYNLVVSQYRGDEFYAQLACALALFVFSFLASSATPNSLRALLYGIAFTGMIVGVCFAITYLGFDVLRSASDRQMSEALNDPSPWLDKARALSEAELAALEIPLVTRYLPLLLILGLVACASPLAVALRFALQNFRHPAAASRSLLRQFLYCVLTTLLAGIFISAAAQWLNHRSRVDWILKTARNQTDLEARLSPAQLQLYRHYRRAQLDENPEQITIRRRTPSGGFGRTLPPIDPSAHPTTPTPGPAPRWTTDVIPVPLTQMTRANVIFDGDIPEDLREALRREAIADGDPRVSPTPGKPPGPWPSDHEPAAANGTVSGFQMSPDLMRRYGLIPSQGGGVHPPISTTNAAANNAPGSGSRTNNPPPRYQMPPEMMRRYGLVPPQAATSDTNSQPPATSNPPTP